MAPATALSSLFAFLSSPTHPPSLPFLKRAHALLILTGAARRRLPCRLLLFFALSPSTPFLPYALLLHSHLPRPDPISSNLLLHTLARLSRPRDLLAFFSLHAHPTNILPNAATLPLLITAAKLLSSLTTGEVLHSLATRIGLLAHLPVPNSLLHMYASCDALDLARQLFDEMPVKDQISYHSLIDGFVQCDDLDKAEDLFNKMHDRNVVSWATLINAFVRKWMFAKAFELLHQMQQQRIDPNDAVIVSLLYVYANLKFGLYGKSVHGSVLRRWMRVPIHVSSALVDFYCKCGMLDAGVAVFGQIKVKDLICWNTMISGLGGQGRGPEALNMFSKMLATGTKPNDITFIGVLMACAHSGLFEEGLRMFEVMRSEFGIKPSFAHYWCLVDLFYRADRPNDALKVIQDMSLETLSTAWGAVIWMARVLGDIRAGECLGKHLIELEPDNSQRYVPLANVYAAASRWDKYAELQGTMKKKGLKKLPDCTLIDLNFVAHKFPVGDKSHPEIKRIYEVLEKVREEMKLQPCRVDPD